MSLFSLSPSFIIFAKIHYLKKKKKKGDGLDDVIIGAQTAKYNSEAWVGAAYLVFGNASSIGTSGSMLLSSLDGTNGLSLYADSVAYTSGCSSVSSAGDFNGDGIDDIIIGTYTTIIYLFLYNFERAFFFLLSLSPPFCM
jgi:hypothetical protein